VYFVEIRSTISQAASPSSHSTTGPRVLYRHHACGEISSGDLRCVHCGEPMHASEGDLLPGPGAAV